MIYDDTILLSSRITIRPRKPTHLPFQHGKYLQKIFYNSIENGEKLHDSSEFKPFAIWPIRYPSTVDREDYGYKLKRQNIGYFDIVVFDNELISQVNKNWKKARGEKLTIGPGKFVVLKVNEQPRSSLFVENIPENVNSLELNFNQPLFIPGEEGYGLLFDLDELEIAPLLESTRKCWNSIFPDKKLSMVEIETYTEDFELILDNSSISEIRFPYYTKGDKIIKKAMKPHLFYKVKGKVEDRLKGLLKLANYVGMGHGRTFGMGKVYSRMR